MLHPSAPETERWLRGRRLVITAGGTREPIDPIRYLGNRSSGRMGHALAERALELGAEVILVTAAPWPPSGEPPSKAGEPPPSPALQVVPVETAAEMLEAVSDALPAADALIMAAAVTDHRPASPSASKLKRSAIALTLELVPTPDILDAVRRSSHRSRLTVVGFAAETEDLVESARRKLEAKELDAVVANLVGVPGTGMGSEDNEVVIIRRDGRVAEVSRRPKPHVAAAICEALRDLLAGR